MTRLLVLLLLAIALWIFLDWLYRRGARALGFDPDAGRRSSGRRGAGAGRAGRGARPGDGRSERPSEALLRCGACGAYVPASRALPLGRTRRPDEPVACSEICRHRLRTGTTD